MRADNRNRGKLTWRNQDKRCIVYDLLMVNYERGWRHKACELLKLSVYLHCAFSFSLLFFEKFKSAVRLSRDAKHDSFHPLLQIIFYQNLQQDTGRSTLSQLSPQTLKQRPCCNMSFWMTGGARRLKQKRKSASHFSSGGSRQKTRASKNILNESAYKCIWQVHSSTEIGFL